MKKLIVTLSFSCALLCAQEPRFKVEELTASERNSLVQAQKTLLDIQRKIRAAHGDSDAATEGLPTQNFNYAVCRSGYASSVELKQGYALITSTYFNNCGGATAFLQ